MSHNKLYYHNSACVTISTSNINILCDPWLTPYCYYGTWGRKPSSLDPFETLVDIDYIFISHIHPDHYCPESLNKIFAAYGPKPILVTDWGNSNNILLNKLRADGFSDNLQVFNDITIGSTRLISYPNLTDSAVNIDTFLIVHDTKYKYSVINFNDCSPSDSTLSFTQDFTLSHPGLVLLCLGYAGAGPYPQNYYSPTLNANILATKAQEKKESFFQRYRTISSKFPDSYRIPFAGKYDLVGPLSLLNQYRGVPDPLEVLNFDSNSYVLADGQDSYFDLITATPSRLRTVPYKDHDIIQKSSNYYWESLFNFLPSLELLKRLLTQSLDRAHQFSKCTEDRLWHIHVYENSTIDFASKLEDPQLHSNLIFTFNTNADKNPLDIPSDILSESHLFIDAKALLSVLLRLTHWNNYEIGSVYQVRRYPDHYSDSHESYLYFLQL